MMRNQQKFYDALAETNEIALATCTGNIPNVRIVNFCFDISRKGILYFATDRDNQKAKEFAQNNNIAFTTVPKNGESTPHARSNDCIVRKSIFSIQQLKELFIAQISGYDEALEAIGDSLDLYEIEIRTAILISGFDETITVDFCPH